MSSQRSPVAVGVMIDGCLAALERLLTTTKDPDARPDETFVPLFEALNWAASIDLRNEELGTPIGDEPLRGMRFARNRVHHQWELANLLDGSASSRRMNTSSSTSYLRIEERELSVKPARPLLPLRLCRQHLATQLHRLPSAQSPHRGSRASAGSQSPHGGVCVTARAKQAEFRSESHTSSLMRAT